MLQEVGMHYRSQRQSGGLDVERRGAGRD